MQSTTAGLDARVDRNRRLAAMLHWYLALPVLVVAVVAGVLVWWLGVLVALVGLLAVALAPRGVETKVLAVVGARPAEESEYPRLVNLVDGLCISHGIAEPELLVLDDHGANALVVAGPDDAYVVVTTGLLEVVDRIGLEGVIAALLARIRSGDAFLGARAAWFIAGRALVGNGPERVGPRRALSGIASGVRAQRLAAVIGSQRDLVGDLDATGLTRYPPGLRDALSAIAERGSAVAPATWGTAHLWLASPFPTDPVDPMSERFDLHDPLVHRIDLLGEQ